MIKQGINKLGESRWDERAAQAPPPLHGNGLCIDVGAEEVGMGGEGAYAALCVCVAVPSPMKALRLFPSVCHHHDPQNRPFSPATNRESSQQQTN